METELSLIINNKKQNNMNLQVAVNQTKEMDIVLYDKVTNQPVPSASVVFNFCTSTDPSIAAIAQGSTPSKVAFSGLKNGGVTGTLQATVSYTNSLGASVSEAKQIPIALAVGTPNETELRLQ